ncbi:hypothetical protein [Massilia sp. Mn16-1_5]|uniref:hypothetical protein n=1 Tax=Massilia sp. Mn16-1_5 TaxID=2079199 RepID=UPI001448238E|nr:hypothetical protein [Massilia sp. Mn16-1_5]
MKPNAQDLAMLRRLFGWHAVPWTDVFCEAVSRLETQPRTVLEVGASGVSAPSLYFLSKGAAVDVTCYADDELPSLKAFCKSICEEYRLPMPSVRTHDVFSATRQTYDVVLLKGVLGGLDRNHNLQEFSRAIDCCKGMLSEKGRLIILDKGWCSPVHNLFLRRFGDAGRANWHYFSQEELEALAVNGERPEVIWKGFASVGTMPSKGLQRFADILDTRIFNRFLSQKGTVFAALYGNDAGHR